MERLKASFAASFRTKVIVPVILAMVAVLAVSMWLVNRRVTRQLQDDATQMLVTADRVLQNSQDYRANQFALRYRNIVNEPRFKAVSGTRDGNTMRGFMEDLLKEKAADVMFVVAAESEDRLAGATLDDPLLNLDQFEAGCASTIRQAKAGQASVDTIQHNGQLFDIVSLPLQVGGDIVGVITFGQKNSVAREFKDLTQTDLVLFSDGQLVSSTITQPDSYGLLVQKVAELSSLRPERSFNPIEEILLNQEHYLCRVGSLGDPNSNHPLRYLIFSSYEQPLQTLEATQRMLLWVSLLAIVLGAAAVWLLVRQATRPLTELRDSAEAVGRGDYSRRVEVRSQDECGELAHVFNRMVENVKQSREAMEATVKRLETTQAQLIQSEKLSGVGEFVAGVAHELNNPLATVLGFAEMLKQMDANPQHRSFVDSVYKSAQRCQKIVQSLLSFARRHQPERKPVCLNNLVEVSLDILRYQLRTGNITVTTKLDPTLPLAMVDSHQIQQVIVNIINNARQAIESHQPQGWITIATECRRPSVRITIQDSGPGIAPENLSRVFDPFFTTKEVGKGTGLGLSLCYGIIKEHGGTITPLSKPGEGATFVIELPSTHISGDTTEVVTKPDIKPADHQEGAGKRVLLIDDEEAILQMLTEFLNCYGYEVDVAADGESGLRQLSRKRYDVTLCDWKMPGLNGRQVYERARQINPAITERMVFITGDLISEKTRQFFQDEGRVCLAKPFALTEFRSVISKVLAA